MGFKIWLYASSVIFGMIVLVCTFSIYQQWEHTRIVMFDVVAIAVCLPLAVYIWRKAGNIHLKEVIEQPNNAPQPLPQRAKVLLATAMINGLLLLLASAWGFYSDDYTLLIVLTLIDMVVIVGLRVYKKVMNGKV